MGLKTRVQTKLNKLGLPESLFDADFTEQYERARALHTELSRRIVELENDPVWKDKDLPWRSAREAYKERVVAGTEPEYLPGVELVQSVRPLWVNMMDDVEKKYRNGGLQPTRELRRAIAGRHPPRPGTRRAAIVAALGVDLAALRAQHRGEI